MEIREIFTRIFHELHEFRIGVHSLTRQNEARGSDDIISQL